MSKYKGKSKSFIKPQAANHYKITIQFLQGLINYITSAEFIINKNSIFRVQKWFILQTTNHHKESHIKGGIQRQQQKRQHTQNKHPIFGLSTMDVDGVWGRSRQQLWPRPDEVYVLLESVAQGHQCCCVCDHTWTPVRCKKHLYIKENTSVL